MFSVPNSVVVIFLFVDALLGMATGALICTIACLCMRLQIRGILKDALLGVLGFFIGFITCVAVSPLNTVTSNAGPNPNVFAFAGAAVLPLLREVYRFKHSRSH